MEQENMQQGGSSFFDKNKKYIVIGGAAILILAVLGYIANGFFAKKAGERIAENLLEQQLGGNVDIDSNGDSASIKTDQGNLSLGDAAKWPSDMPSDVPEFTAGKLTMAGTSLVGGQGWQILAEEVDEKDFTDYHATLETKGWVNIGIFDAGVGVIQMSKGNTTLTVGYNSEDKTFVLTVIVGQ
jgi:hypothetical protein